MDFFLPKTGSVCVDTLGPFPGFDLKTCTSENQSTCHWSSIQWRALTIKISFPCWENLRIICFFFPQCFHTPRFSIPELTCIDSRDEPM
jgi:hypothetical protein